MMKREKISVALDFVGAGGLIAATGALISQTWLDIAPESTLFPVFFGSLAVAVVAFALARFVQIGQIVLTRSSAIADRESAAVSNITPVRQPIATAETGQPDFQRAA
jgi:hypothetical protein